MYDSNDDGTLDSETFIILPTVGNTAERHLIIDCNLNQLNFTVRAVSGITLSTTIPLDCAISSLHHVSSTSKLMLNFYCILWLHSGPHTPIIHACNRKNIPVGMHWHQSHTQATWPGYEASIGIYT